MTPRPSYGRSEKLIGTAFKHRRDKVVICTKTVDFEIGKSLRHFGYIDVLLTHHRVQIISEELIRRMNGFVADGECGSGGCRHRRRWTPTTPLFGRIDHRSQFEHDGHPRHRLWPVGRNGIHRQNAAQFRLPLRARSPKDTIFPPGPSSCHKQPRERILDWIKRSRECLGDTPPGPESVRKAINWVLAHPISTVVVGMMTREEVEANTA